MARKEAVLRSLPPLRACPSYPGYLASEDGDIYSVALCEIPRLLKGYFQRYWVIGITINGVVKMTKKHHMIADAFHGPKPEGLIVRHLNDDRKDNRPQNLCYGTHKDNSADKARNRGTSKFYQGPRRRHLSRFEAQEIRKIKHQMTLSEAAGIYGVTPTTISKIWNNRTYLDHD